MNIFIAGARAITSLDKQVRARLSSICEKGYNVLVGDADGVDSSVQRFYADLGYGNVTVFAGNGRARNNIGHWTVENVVVDEPLKGFDFYKQKDQAMADKADYGFMIWNGESKGTLNNIINLIKQDKDVLVYFAPQGALIKIDELEKLNRLVTLCPGSVQRVYGKLLKEAGAYNQQQLVLF